MITKNILSLDWCNQKDIGPLKDYCNKHGKLNIIRFEEIHECKYTTKLKIFRYLTALYNFKLDNLKLYSTFFKKRVINNNPQINNKNVMKLTIMNLTQKDYINILNKHQIKAIIIYREDSWLYNIIKWSKELNIKVIVLSNENNFGVNRIVTSVFSGFYDRSDLKLVGGENAKSTFSYMKNTNKDNIKIIGVPRMDTYFKQKFITKEQFYKKFNLDINKQIILFPSFINIFKLNKIIINESYLYQDINPLKLDNLFTHKKIKHIDFKETKERMINQLIKNYPKDKYHILIKLHPDQLKNELFCCDTELKYMDNNNEHIKIVSNELKAPDFIANSHYVAGFNSTMMLEAILLKKKLIFMNFGAVKDLWHLPFNNKTNKEIIKYYFYKFDGKATERAYNEILKLLK